MTVAFPHLSAEPTVVTAALWERAADLTDLTVISGMLLSGYKFLSMPCARNLRFKTWFLPGTLLRKTAPDVQAEYLPLTWARTARFLDESSFDSGLIHVSPADADGYHSFGVCCTAAKGIAGSSKLLIAQVNPNMPRTLGDARIHTSDIDILVEGDVPLAEYPNRPLDEIDSEIGRRVAELIPDGSSISLGVGGIPLAAANALIDKGAKDLRFINTFTDPTMALIEAGCATADSPKAETGDIFGTKALYDWVANNPDIALASALTTHRPEDFVRRKTVVSVNSALEIDLLGQVNAETIGGKQTGSMGGLIDFAVGGQVDGGQFILGLRSQTNGGRPWIVPQLDGHIVSLSRTFVETVVTEYGVAQLRGLSVRERALALADIAHPDDRAALRAHATTL
ncbi:acetyl-CoA hydrolase/transferase family protein [Tropicibacter naphthalenivorans]|uniref:Succinyl-CoA:coenzyme A transferase n=1 Tax=Tropicibacter naphthalenivorans TaxID=441103 RepID=A0A0P1GHY6_9RHOB|nr:acetyl-CoA hydrolase/transferase C-terminal domain-containing protein [Tropicibacter naphthalenivorans]CUH81359.1 Succinyl-CoA:coenzyme A transferase [Tropicibacter naphthalenivorans]SMC98566.1 4-hydroxybutyrate CoA-transferase [Tropicibacter naphthalenivorans]